MNRRTGTTAPAPGLLGLPVTGSAGPVATSTTSSIVVPAPDRVHGTMTGRPEGRPRATGGGGGPVPGPLAGILAVLRSRQVPPMVAAGRAMSDPVVSVPCRSWPAGTSSEPAAGARLWTRPAAVAGRGC